MTKRNTSVINMLTHHPRVGKQAFDIVKAKLKPVNGSTEIWPKLGDKFFLFGHFNQGFGDFPVYKTYKTGPETKDRAVGRKLGNFYEYARAWSEQNEGGVFYLPCQPQGYPGKDAIAYSDDIAMEMDEGTAEQQWAWLEEFVQITGLYPSFIIGSGGSSYHAHWKGIEHFPIEQTIYLRQLLAIAGDGDPAITNPHQPMRLPGFYRLEKENEQKLFYHSDSEYTFDEFIAGFKRYFEAKGLPWQPEISDDRWRKYQKARRDQDYDGAIAILAKSEQQEREEREQRERQRQQRRAERQRQRAIHGWLGTETIEDALERATDALDYDEIFEWEGHHFKNDGRHKLVGYCPQHQSSSGTAFQVNPETNEWYCHSCQVGGGPVQYRDFLDGGDGNPTGKDFIEVARELCHDAGVEFPESESLGNIKQQADETLIEKEGETPASPERWIQKAIGDVLDKQLDDLSLEAQRQEVKREFDQKPELYERIPKDPIVNYKPGRLEELDQPVIYPAGKRHEVWSEAAAKSYKFVLDSSEMGQGKTSDVAKLHTSQFDFGTETDEDGNESPAGGQLVAFLNEPDSPPVDLQSHNWKRLTVLSKENCRHSDKRKALGQKGIGKSGGTKNKDTNPICASCSYLLQCRNSVDTNQGYGFKNLIQSDYAYPKLYGHPKGFAREDNSSAIAFIDEFGQLIPPVTTEEVGLGAFLRFWKKLKQIDSIVCNEGETLINLELSRIATILENYLSGHWKLEKFGIDMATIQQQMPALENPEKFRKLIDYIEGLEQEWLQEALGSIDSETSPSAIASLVDRPFFAHLLKVIYGFEKGAVRIKYSELGNQLIITRPNTEQIDLIRSFKNAFFLDATMTKDDLVFEYGFNPDEILEIRQEPIDTPNLTVTQLSGAGLNTQHRSQAGQRRKQQILDAISQQHSDFGSIDYRDHAQEGELHHHRSGEEGARGSNRFQNKQAVVSFGTPYISLSSCLDTYQAITGEVVDGQTVERKEHEAFNHYYRRITQKNIIQNIGRLRANLRQEQQLIFYMVSDFDPTFLRNLGVNVIRKPVWHLVPDLKPIKYQRLQGLAHFFASLWYRGQEVLNAKQKEATQQLGEKQKATKQIFSRLTKQLGGWIGLKQKVNRLLKTLGGAVNFDDFYKLLETELFNIYGFDLTDTQEQLISAIEQHDWQKVEGYFKAATVSQKGEMMAVLLSILIGDAGDWLERLRSVLIDKLGLSEAELGIESPPG